MRGLRNAACEYADRGWAVLPLRPRHKAPLGQLVPNGKDGATSDLATVLRWWTRAPAANVGLNCGASGLVVLDVDPRSGGDDSLHELERELGRLPETVRAETGGGGEHYLFRHPGVDLVGVAAPGLDVKDRGYIVAPPSVHPSGKGYAWDLAPDEVDVTELPEAWLARLRQPTGLRRPSDLIVSADHDDELRRIPAAIYVARLTGREVERGGWVRCPFHRGGTERTASLQVDGTIWACHACSPIGGKRAMGGNIYDFGGLLADYPLPLRGADFLDVQGRLCRVFGASA